jgi:hypothetical protein
MAVVSGAVLAAGAVGAVVYNLFKERPMALKKVFVSFDWDNDRRYKYLLEAWHAHPQFDFVFDDLTPTEIQSTDVGRIKAALTAKINRSNVTLVIVGKEANKQHKDHQAIGCKNYLNFEIKQSKGHGNKVIAVKLDNSYVAPDELYGSGAIWVSSFNEPDIVAALNKA